MVQSCFSGFCKHRNSWSKSSNLIKNDDYNNKFRLALKDMWLSF